MRDDLVRFAESYYHVDWDETTDSRRATVDALGIVISDEARSSMDFTVYVNSDADHTRINSRLTMAGTLSSSDIEVLSRLQSGRVVYVAAPVTVTTTWPDGRVYNTSSLRVGTVWQCQADGSWVMTGFGESGDMS